MAKYSKKSQEQVESAMHRMHKGKLKSGNSGATVKNPKQAIAIGLSEAREKGAKVPSKKSSAKKSTAKKSASKKSASKKTVAKKTATKKSTMKKAAAKKTTKKKAAAKKSTSKNKRYE